MIRVLALLAAVLAAAVCGAGLLGHVHRQRRNPGSSFTTAANFAPVVTLAAPAAGSATNGTTPTLERRRGQHDGRHDAPST